MTYFKQYETRCERCGEEEEYIASGGPVPCARCGADATIVVEKDYVQDAVMVMEVADIQATED